MKLNENDIKLKTGMRMWMDNVCQNDEGMTAEWFFGSRFVFV